MKKKLAVFCLPNLDNFLQWVPHLEDEYDVKLIVTSDNKEVFRAMAWAEIIFVEWANEMAVNISRHMINTPNAADKKLIIRLHSYEVFTELPNRIIWEDVTCLTFVANHMMEIMWERFAHAMLMTNFKKVVIPNGVDWSNIEFLDPGYGLNICAVGGISHKKNPAMAIQILDKAIRLEGRKFKLHFAGAFQEKRYEIYLRHIIKEMKLENNVIFHGQLSKEEMDLFWRDKHFILNTSPHEGHPVSVIQGMCRGLTPVIHRYRGSDMFPAGNLYNTVDEAASMLNYIRYEGALNRKRVKRKGWTSEKQATKFKEILKNL